MGQTIILRLPACYDTTRHDTTATRQRHDRQTQTDGRTDTTLHDMVQHDTARRRGVMPTRHTHQSFYYHLLLLLLLLLYGPYLPVADWQW